MGEKVQREGEYTRARDYFLRDAESEIEETDSSRSEGAKEKRIIKIRRSRSTSLSQLRVSPRRTRAISGTPRERRGHAFRIVLRDTEAEPAASDDCTRLRNAPEDIAILSLRIIVLALDDTWEYREQKKTVLFFLIFVYLRLCVPTPDCNLCRGRWNGAKLSFECVVFVTVCVSVRVFFFVREPMRASGTWGINTLLSSLRAARGRLAFRRDEKADRGALLDSCDLWEGSEEKYFFFFWGR